MLLNLLFSYNSLWLVTLVTKGTITVSNIMALRNEKQQQVNIYYTSCIFVTLNENDCLLFIRNKIQGKNGNTMLEFAYVYAIQQPGEKL